MISKIDEEMLARYLLGELNDAEQEQVELRYLEDREYFDALQVAEDELIDGYVRDALGPARREHFEKHFLNSPDRHRRVNFALAFKNLLSGPEWSPDARKTESGSSQRQRGDSLRGERRDAKAAGLVVRSSGLAAVIALFRGERWLRLGAVTAGVIFVIFGSIFVIKTRALRSQLEALQAEQSQSRDTIKGLNKKVEELTIQAEGPKAMPTPPEKAEGGISKEASSKHTSSHEGLAGVLALVLSPGQLSRGDSGDRQAVRLSSKDQFVILTLLPVEEEYPGYRVSLTPNAEKQAFLPGVVKAHGTGANRNISIRVDARKLVEADYRLKLYGLSADNAQEYLSTYYFKVFSKR